MLFVRFHIERVIVQNNVPNSNGCKSGLKLIAFSRYNLFFVLFDFDFFFLNLASLNWAIHHVYAIYWALNGSFQVKIKFKLLNTAEWDLEQGPYA